MILVLIFFLQLQKTIYLDYFPTKLVVMLSSLPSSPWRKKNPKKQHQKKPPKIPTHIGTLILLSAAWHELMPGDEMIPPLEHTCKPAPPQRTAAAFHSNFPMSHTAIQSIFFQKPIYFCYIVSPTIALLQQYVV